jgi:hypothetical protein
LQRVWKTPVADDRYVAERAWEGAILCECPLHPEGGCGLQKLGTYGRVEPPGTRIPRWWCPLSRRSISLLPAFLAARLSGTLHAVEVAVATMDATGSVAAAVDIVHPPDAEGAVGLVAAMRSLRRRMRAVRAALLAILTLMPDEFAGLLPTLSSFRQALGCEHVLVTLRLVVERHVSVLPVPLGFGTRGRT